MKVDHIDEYSSFSLTVPHIATVHHALLWSTNLNEILVNLIKAKVVMQYRTVYFVLWRTVKGILVIYHAREKSQRPC